MASWMSARETNAGAKRQLFWVTSGVIHPYSCALSVLLPSIIKMNHLGLTTSSP